MPANSATCSDRPGLETSPKGRGLFCIRLFAIIRDYSTPLGRVAKLPLASLPCAALSGWSTSRVQLADPRKHLLLLTSQRWMGFLTMTGGDRREAQRPASRRRGSRAPRATGIPSGPGRVGVRGPGSGQCRMAGSVQVLVESRIEYPPSVRGLSAEKH